MHAKRSTIPLLVMLLLLSGCEQEKKVPVFNDHFIQMWAQTLEPYAVDIAFYGDSRVALGDWQQAYAAQDVVNLGIGGDTVEGTIQRLPLLAALDVKHCFLAIGVNNCSSNSFSASVFRTNYTALLNGLENLGITVYVQTVAGVNSENSSIPPDLAESINARVLLVNQIIRESAAGRGMLLIDMASVMNSADGSIKIEYTNDGIHFSDAGNQLWYDSLRPYVEAVPN